MKEEEPNNGGLYLLFVALLLIMFGVAYARLPAVSSFVDAKAPWFRDKVGHYFAGPKPEGDQPASDSDAPGAVKVAGPQPFDLAIFAAHPELWPKSVALKASIQFPAVVNNKPVGSIRAPVGSEVHIVKVENGKLGVEFRGGGAWVAPEATDVAERVQAIPAPHP
jgi:hypothetical protein